MNRHVRAAAPQLLRLAQESKFASASLDLATTHYEKRAYVANLDGINDQLVSHAFKLGSAVLQSLSASKAQDSLEKEKEKPDSDLEKKSMSIGKGLATGAAIAAVPALAANYTLNKASDDLDSKMLAIPGLAAATVGAILAARNLSSGGGNSPSPEQVSELKSAIDARQVVEAAKSVEEDPQLAEELSKMSSISTDHIASLLTEILT
jgi:hypothetical protein